MTPRYSIAAALLVFCAAAVCAQPAGHLVIIGGGDKPPAVLKTIVDLAGGPDAKIVIIPNASSDPRGSAEYNLREFTAVGARNVEFLLFNRSTADNDSTRKKFAGAAGVFFSGGDQAFLTRDLLGTQLFEDIRRVYERGGVISGTSAGAAVMSEVMITGNELKNKDTTDIFKTIEAGNVHHTQGFGFVTAAIIDQHFIKRKRLNRLISIVLEHPLLLGVGIDEETAILVNPDQTFTVLGENQVVVLDPARCPRPVEAGTGILGVENMTMHVLLPGARYDMKNRTMLH